MQVPAGTHAGDYVGAISAENPVPTAAPPSGQGVGLNITQRSVIAVVVHVPGQLTPPNFKVGKPTIAVENQRRQVITFPLTYGGDTLIKPHLAFSIVGSDGKTLLHFDQQLDTFVPHTTIHYPFPIDKTILAAGHLPGDRHVRQRRTRRRCAQHARSPSLPRRPTCPRRTSAAGRRFRQQTPRCPRGCGRCPSSSGPWCSSRLPAPRCCGGGARAATASGTSLRGLILVEDFHEIANCPPCRARALEREQVRLCQTCYRSHVLARREAPAAAESSSSPPRGR